MSHEPPMHLTPEDLRQGLVIEVPPEGVELPPVVITFRGGPLRIERVSIVGECRPFLILGEPIVSKEHDSGS